MSSDRWDFELPTRVRFGCGRLALLGETAAEYGKSAMLVGYADRTGLEEIYARAEKLLSQAGVAVTPFYEVPPDPDAQLAQDGARQAAAAGVELVIGLGGGSAIDCAKGIAALVKMGGELWEYAGSNPQGKTITQSLPVIAVPTTAGTGSEVTAVAVFTHHGVGSQEGIPLKASINGPALRPKVALVDPEPREPLALASVLAGAAFSNAGVVLPHAIGQALGSLLHISHGEAVAIGTPPNLRFNAECCQELYCRLAHYCGSGGDSPHERAAGFVQHVIGLLKQIGLPDRVDPGDWDRDVLAEQLTVNAYESTAVPIRLNPREVDHASLKSIFLEILL